MMSNSLSDCPMIQHVSRSRHNELALVDEHGNTVGVLVSNEQPQYSLSPRNEIGLHLKYPVPCSKLANVTIEWLKKNFQENQYNSLPRNVMFEEYTSFCYGIDMKSFNQAVFGKIVRACFPNLTTRRLGVRGQSRYHYAGLGTKPTSCYVERFRSIQEKRNGVRAVNSLRKKKTGNKSSIIRSQSRTDGRQKQLKNNATTTVTLDSLMLSTSSYPTAEDIDTRFGWPINILDEFISFYRDFNHRLLNYILKLDFEKTMIHLRSFSVSVPPNCRGMMETTEACYILSLCDDVMYQKATATLLPNCLATLTTEFNDVVRKYAKTLPVWIGETCNHDSSINPSVFESRVNSARSWCDYVRRVTTLCHVTKEARKTLADPGIVMQLLGALQNLQINDTIEQCSYASCYNIDRDADAILEKTTRDKEKTKELVLKFSKLLERMVSVERFAALLEEIINDNAGLLPEPQLSSPDHCFDIITPKTRLFMMKWSMYGSKLLTEITLRSSESVGTFILIMLLFGDYVNHMICLRQERADRLKRKRDIIKRDSPYLHAHRFANSSQTRTFSAFTPVSASTSSNVMHPTQFSHAVHVKEETTLTTYHASHSQQPTYFSSYMTPPPNQAPSYPQYHQPNQAMCHTAMQSSAFTTYYQPIPHSVSMPGPSPYQQVHQQARYGNPNMGQQPSMMVEPAQCSNDASSYYLLSNATQQRSSTESADEGSVFKKL